MYNDEFLQHIIHKYGVNTATMFCKIESEKYEKTINIKRFSDPIERSEMEYERTWWSQRAEKLKNNEPC
jgi:hypothetical protein